MIKKHVPKFVKIILLDLHHKYLNLIKRWEYRGFEVYFPLSAMITKNTTFSGANKIGHNTYFKGSIGYCSYIGANSRISASIGNFCSISDSVISVSGMHPTTKFVSTSPAFYSLQKVSNITFVENQKFDEYKRVSDDYEILIEHDVCISADVKILGGVTIGVGAIIGMGAVVTKDVAPYSIVAGVPAKIIGWRFEKSQIDFLVNSKWWERDDEWYKKNSYLFSDIQTFMSEYPNDDINNA